MAGGALAGGAGGALIGALARNPELAAILGGTGMGLGGLAGLIGGRAYGYKKALE